MKRSLQLASELVRVFPLEITEERLLGLGYLCESLSWERRGAPLGAWEFVRTEVGIDVTGFADLLAEAERRGLIASGVRPAYYEGVRRVLRPGPRAGAAEDPEIRAIAAFVARTHVATPAQALRREVLESLAVSSALPGERLALDATSR